MVVVVAVVVEAVPHGRYLFRDSNTFSSNFTLQLEGKGGKNMSR